MVKASALSPEAILEIENPGPGLFTDARAEASFSRAHERIGILLAGDGLAFPSSDTALNRDLLDICRNYWADWDHDQRQRLPTVRDEVAKLDERLGLVAGALATLSVRTRGQLTTELTRAGLGSGAAVIDDLQAQIDKLRKVCAPLVRHRGSKKGGGSESIPKCCRRLMDLRETLTNRPFSRTWAGKPSDGDYVEAFVGDDAQFLLEVAKAIDASITFSKVRSAGMASKRAPSSQK